MSSFSYRKLLQIADDALTLLDQGMTEKDICIELKIKYNTLEKALEYAASHNSIKCGEYNTSPTNEIPISEPIPIPSHIPVIMPESQHPTPSPSPPITRDMNFKYKILQHHISGLNIKTICKVMDISEQEALEILTHFNMMQ